MDKNRLIGLYLAVVGAAVAVQFVLYPLYGHGTDAGTTIWLALDWFMALGLLLALYTTNQRRMTERGDGNASCSSAVTSSGAPAGSPPSPARASASMTSPVPDGSWLGGASEAPSLPWPSSS